jgi:hypothetical protein
MHPLGLARPVPLLRTAGLAVTYTAARTAGDHVTHTNPAIPTTRTLRAHGSTSPSDRVRNRNPAGNKCIARTSPNRSRPSDRTSSPLIVHASPTKCMKYPMIAPTANTNPVGPSASPASRTSGATSRAHVSGQCVNPRCRKIRFRHTHRIRHLTRPFASNPGNGNFNPMYSRVSGVLLDNPAASAMTATCPGLAPAAVPATIAVLDPTKMCVGPIIPTRNGSPTPR